MTTPLVISATIRAATAHRTRAADGAVLDACGVLAAVDEESVTLVDGDDVVQIPIAAGYRIRARGRIDWEAVVNLSRREGRWRVIALYAASEFVMWTLYGVEPPEDRDALGQAA